MKPLKLDESLFVAMGQRCLVFQHPDQKDLLVKVLNPQFKERKSYKKKLSQLFPALNRFRLSKCFARELMENIRLRFTEPYCQVNCIQQVHGFVDTDKGFGLVVKAEKTQDGALAPTLRSLLKVGQLDNDLQQELNDFYQHLAACDIAVSDLRPRNIVYAYNKNRQSNHFVLIDGIGEKTFIPVQKISSSLRKRSRVKQIYSLKKEVMHSLQCT